MIVMTIRIVGLAPEAAGTAPGRQSGQKMPDLQKNRALLVALPFKLPSNDGKILPRGPIGVLYMFQGTYI